MPSVVETSNTHLEINSYSDYTYLWQSSITADDIEIKKHITQSTRLIENLNRSWLLRTLYRDKVSNEEIRTNQENINGWNSLKNIEKGN